MEIHGMCRALEDFSSEMGHTPEYVNRFMIWVCGDGGMHATIERLKRYNANLVNNAPAIRHWLLTLEVWHTHLTLLRAISANHYGSLTSLDPASLSHSSAAVDFKIPSDSSNCIFYSTEHHLRIIWIAHVLDCWMLTFNIPLELWEYFWECQQLHQNLPTMEELLIMSQKLVQKYTLKAAIWSMINPSQFPPPKSMSWTPPVSSHSKDGANLHVEEQGFEEDRVLANKQLFLGEFGAG
jgi:hypothetical protein